MHPNGEAFGFLGKRRDGANGVFHLKNGVLTMRLIFQLSNKISTSPEFDYSMSEYEWIGDGEMFGHQCKKNEEK